MVVVSPRWAAGYGGDRLVWTRSQMGWYGGDRLAWARSQVRSTEGLHNYYEVAREPAAGSNKICLESRQPVHEE